MFIFCKFQKFINVSQGKFILLWFLKTKGCAVLFKVSAISCIFFPCLLVSFNITFANEGLESNHGVFMPVNSGTDNIIGGVTNTISKRIGGEESFLFGKGGTKDGCGSAELLPSHDIDGVFVRFSNGFFGSSVAYATTEENTQNSASNTESTTDNTSNDCFAHNLLLSALFQICCEFIGCTIGCVIGVAILLLSMQPNGREMSGTPDLGKMMTANVAKLRVKFKNV
jgi:hypothetical protein